MVYYERLKVFICSSLDHSFKVFDKSFKLLQTSQHNERAILSLQYSDIYFKENSTENEDSDNKSNINSTNNAVADPVSPTLQSQTQTAHNVIVKNGCLISTGTTGLLLWKVTHTLSLKRQNAHQASNYTIVKMHTFPNYKEWISKMTYDAVFDRIYLFIDRSVHVLNLKDKAVVCCLKNAHDTPTTTAIWYSRSNFYVTDCR